MYKLQQQQWIDPSQQRMAEQESAMNFANNQGKKNNLLLLLSIHY